LHDLGERAFQVFLYVVAQRLERRNVNNFGAVLQVACNGFAYQLVYAA